MDIPIEFRQRMLAEQMAMVEALQFIAQLLIYFVIVLALAPRRLAARLCDPVGIFASSPAMHPLTIAPFSASSFCGTLLGASPHHALESGLAVSFSTTGSVN
jgi:hypothetical protein